LVLVIWDFDILQYPFLQPFQDFPGLYLDIQLLVFDLFYDIQSYLELSQK